MMPSPEVAFAAAWQIVAATFLARVAANLEFR
jgi:hypothetical protein